MNVLCAQLSIPHLPLMNIAALRPTDTKYAATHNFHWSIERMQRTAVLSAVRVPLQGLGSLFLSLLGRELFVHRRQSI